LAELTTPWRIPTRCLRRTTILWSTPRSLTTATSWPRRCALAPVSRATTAF